MRPGRAGLQRPLQSNPSDRAMPLTLLRVTVRNEMHAPHMGHRYANLDREGVRILSFRLDRFRTGDQP